MYKLLFIHYILTIYFISIILLVNIFDYYLFNYFACIIIHSFRFCKFSYMYMVSFRIKLITFLFFLFQIDKNKSKINIIFRY